MSKIMAVDTNLEVNERHETEWVVKFGINSLRVNTMCEAVFNLSRGGEFLFVVINEDTISDIELNLSALRNVTDIPIFILTSTYRVDKKIKAMNCGVDLYENFSSYVKDEVRAGFEFIKPRNRPAPLNLPKDLICGDILLSPSQHRVVVKDIEIDLSKKEFAILQYLMANHNCVVPHLHLLQKVWGNEYGMNDVNLLWRTMDRLRKKLPQISPVKEYIKIKRGVGYKLSVLQAAGGIKDINFK